MSEDTLLKLLSDGNILQLERWNKDWIATLVIRNHSLHVKDENLTDLLLYLLEWKDKEKIGA